MSSINIEISIPEIGIEIFVSSPSIEVEIPNVVFNYSEGGGDPVLIRGFNEIYTYEADPGEEVILPNVLVKNTLGSDLLNLDPGQIGVAPNGIVTDSEDNPIASVPSGTAASLPNILITEINGDVSSVPAQRNAACQFFDILIKDFQGNEVLTLEAYQPEIVLPDPRLTAHPQRLIPTQWDSYRIGDIGWHLQNGTFDHDSDLLVVAHHQCLDYATYGADGHYYLVHNNIHGNKHRFTDTLGNPASDGKARFESFPSGALDGIIQDHYRHIAFDVSFEYMGTWNACIDAIHASTKYGINTWYPISYMHLLDVLNPAVPWDRQEQIFWYMDVVGLTPTFIWAGGETLSSSTGNAYRFRETTAMAESVGKTATALYMIAAYNF